MHTAYKNKCRKVRSIYLSLVWHNTEKKKKKEKEKEVNTSTFVRKRILFVLPGIGVQCSTTTIDPVTKIIYGKIKIGVVNITYDELFNDDDTTPRVYKTSWILNLVAS